MRKIKIKVTPKQNRLDQFLAHEVRSLSRSRIKKLINDEFIKVNGEPADPNYKPVGGDEIILEIPPPRPTEIKPEKIDLKIVYEDGDILVVDKEAGLVTHPTLDHPSGTLVNALLFHFKKLPGIGSLRPGIVHRLDRGTSGLLVVAKSEKALESLKEQFRARGVTKKYICLVQGRIEKSSGLINEPIDRHQVNRKKARVPTREAFRL